MVDTAKAVELIAAISLLGLPVILVLVTAGSILTGFVVYELVGLINRIIIPLLIFGVGIFATYFGFKVSDDRNDYKFAGMGLLVLIGSLVTLVAYSSGFLAGPTNSFSLLGFSVIPSSAGLVSGLNYVNVILQTLFFAGGVGLFGIEIYRLKTE